MPSLRSRRVVIEGEVRAATVVYEKGTVVEIGDATADLDFGDLMVMPGLVDSHVHVNEPGRTSWEGFDTATRAAAAGGTTTIVDMPLNSIPPTVDVESLQTKQDSARGRLSVDTGFWGGLSPGSEVHLEALASEGVCGFKSFLVDSGVPEFPPIDPEDLRSGLKVLTRLGVPGLIHAEHPEMIEPHSGDPRSYRDYLVTRPAEAEVEAVRLLAALAAELGAAVHVVHVSSSAAAEIIGGSSLTGETCPHYLTFAAEEIPAGATEFKCAPPIRGRAEREALWELLSARALDMVVSDHSPAPPEMKELASGDFTRAWGGISSLQLRLPATWTGAAERGIGLMEISRWLATAPASIAGLDDRKGSISVGKDADFVIWDPDEVTAVAGTALQHRHPLTPYEGLRLRGRVIATILRGTPVFEEGRVSPNRGRMLRRR